MDLISNVFYRSRFDVFPAEKDWNVFIQITKHIINWCKHKAKLYGIELNWDWKRFRQYGTFEANGLQAVSTRFTDKKTGARYWAAKIYETEKKDGYADRTWISEFGIEQLSDEYVTFSYTVMYQDRQGFLGELQPPPKANIPSIVNYLLTNKHIVCKSGNVVLGLHSNAIPSGQMNMLHDVLRDDSRTCPVVYSTSNKKGEHFINHDDLAKLVAGNAVVFYSQHPEACDEFDSLIGDAFRCPDGGLRIYQPRINWENKDEVYRHIFFTEEKLHEMGKDRIQSILRRALCENIQYYTAKQLFRFDDCIELYDSSRREEMKTLAAQAQENEFLFNDEAKQLREAKSQLEKVSFELQSALDNCEKETQKNRALTIALDETTGLRESFDKLQRAQSKVSNMAMLPQTSKEVVDIFLSIHPDKMDFTQKGFASLKSCAASNSLLWQALFSMATTLRDLYITNDSVNIVRAFEEKTTFSLALTEGSETRKDKTFMGLREDKYAGDEINIEPHISYGNFRGDKSKSIRVYYAYHPKTQKIIVGYCGEHLPNYSTKKIR